MPRDIFGHFPLNAVSSSGLARVGSEIIPDSEEERHELNPPKSVLKIYEVIEISSDEDSDDCCTKVTASPTKPSRITPQTTKKRIRQPYNTFRKIIESSEEESAEEVIELTDDSSDEPDLRPRNILALPQIPIRQRSPSHPHDAEPSLPTVDEGIIIFDEPRSARKPIRLNDKGANANVATKTDDKPQTTYNKATTSINVPSSSATTLTPALRRLTGKAPPTTPRSNSKKAQLLAKQQKLYEYAQELFTDLNKSVFNGGLPDNTKLNWNKRLLTTAGRAKYHRSRDGVQSTEIELAEKILDCEERIRNTVSHEMCHLATWTIDRKLKENHGPLFKDWANKVMKKHPQIHVSVRHNYDISYPYEWKCEKCSKIYGRHSKSINPKECVCGACKEGKLIPLFTTKRAPSTPKVSKLAAAKPQDSPRTLQNTPTKGDVSTLVDTDSDDGAVEILTKRLATTSITL